MCVRRWGIPWSSILSSFAKSSINSMQEKLTEENIFKGIHSNKLFLSIIAITIVLQVVMVEYLKWIEGTKSLNRWQWAACIGMAIVSWLVGWIVKRIHVPQKPFLSYLKNERDIRTSPNIVRLDWRKVYGWTHFYYFNIKLKPIVGLIVLSIVLLFYIDRLACCSFNYVTYSWI